MSSVSPESSASNAGQVVEPPKFPFVGGVVPGELTDLQASLLMKYYDACIAFAGFSGNSPGGSCVCSAIGASSDSSSSVASGGTGFGKKKRSRNKKKKKKTKSDKIHAIAGLVSSTLVKESPASERGNCYEKMLARSVDLGQWPTVQSLLSLPSDDVLENLELDALNVQRVGIGAYHVGTFVGPSLLSALAATVMANSALVDGSDTLANRLDGVFVPYGLRKFPLQLTDVLGGMSAGAVLGDAGLRSVVSAHGLCGDDLVLVVEAAREAERITVDRTGYESCLLWNLDGRLSLSSELVVALLDHWQKNFDLEVRRNAVSVDFSKVKRAASGFGELRVRLPAGSRFLRVVNPEYGYSCVVFDKPVGLAESYCPGQMVSQDEDLEQLDQVRSLLFSGQGERFVRLDGAADHLMMRCLFSGETDLHAVRSVPEVLAAADLLSCTIEYPLEEQVVMVADIRYNAIRMRPRSEVAVAAVRFLLG